MQPFILIVQVAPLFIIDHNYYVHIQTYSNATTATHRWPSLWCTATTTTYNHHHHPVQVATRVYSFVCTSLMLQGKTLLAQVAVGDDHHECRWRICTSWWKGKTPPAQVAQCQDHLGHKPIGVGCSNQMQVAQGLARSALRWCPCASCIWLLHPVPILVPKMVLTLCNLRWWCYPSINSYTPPALMVVITTATCTGGVTYV